uniref:Ig-like domain-containing protein n=1 Tax=Panthera tigris altaica TaxID=74533 RepID=A0A8C9M4M9_PANTA
MRPTASGSSRKWFKHLKFSEGSTTSTTATPQHVLHGTEFWFERTSELKEQGARGRAVRARLFSRGHGGARLLRGHEDWRESCPAPHRGSRRDNRGAWRGWLHTACPHPGGPRWESGGHRVEVVCVSPGPADVHFVWEKNGRELEMCVPTQTHALPDGRAHVLSWLRDAIRESAEYRCSVLSSAGNGTSKVRVTVVRHEATHQEQWTRELAAWKAVAGEHDRMMHSWRKAWESCDKGAL